MKQKQQEEMQNKAAEQWLRLKIGEGNAKRLERRTEWEKQQTLKKIEDKARSVDELNEHKKTELIKRKRQAELITFKKNDMMKEFNGIMKTGGEIDLKKLAKQFDLDLDELEKKVEEESKRGIPEASNQDADASSS